MKEFKISNKRLKMQPINIPLTTVVSMQMLSARGILMNSQFNVIVSLHLKSGAIHELEVPFEQARKFTPTTNMDA